MEVLCVTLVAAVSGDSVLAATCDAVIESADSCEETDVIEDLLATFLQWLDNILDSAAAGHTSAISIWNH